LARAYTGFGALPATVATFDLTPGFGLGFTSFMAGIGLQRRPGARSHRGAELFTRNNLMIFSAFTKEITFSAMLRRLAIVHSIGVEKMVLKGLISGLAAMQMCFSRSAKEFTHGE
jgi:hypothetical protein